jgi:hypothetical protein
MAAIPATNEDETIRQRLAAVGMVEEPGTEIVLFHAASEHDKRNYTLAELGDRTPASFDGELYVASGLFEAGSIDAKGKGRFWGNLHSIVSMVFDSDSWQYLKLDPATKNEIYEYPLDELDEIITNHRNVLERIIAECGIRFHRLDRTGHGLCGYISVHPKDRTNLIDIRAHHAELIRTINDRAGFELIDRKCSDSGTRVTRVPGSFNNKGSTPKPVTTLYYRAGQHLRVTRTDRPADEIVQPLDLPEVGSVMAKDAIARLVTITAPYWVDGQRHNLSMDFAGALAHAWVPESEARSIVAKLAAKDRNPRDRLKSVTDTYEKAREGVPVSGLPSLRSWMPETVVEAIDGVLAPYRERMAPQVSLPTVPPRITDDDDSFAGTTHPPANSIFDRFLTAAELCALEPEEPDWIAKPYIVAGAVTDIGSQPKAGKTTLLGYLVRQVTSGGDFLGFATSQTPVVYLTEQSGTTFREILVRSNLTDCQQMHVLSWHTVRQELWPLIVEAAVAKAKAVGARLLIVDTLPQFAGLRGDTENNAGAALEAIQPVQAAAASGLAVVIVRHERKGGGEVGESSRGSSAFAGAVDIIVQLKKAEGNARPTLRILNALSRFDDTPTELTIERAADGSYASLGPNQAFEKNRVRQAILDAASRFQVNAKSADEFVPLIPNAKRATVQDAIKKLEAEAILQKTGSGKKGDPFRYWVANEPEYLSQNPPEMHLPDLKVYVPANEFASKAGGVFPPGEMSAPSGADTPNSFAGTNTPNTGKSISTDNPFDE